MMDNVKNTSQAYYNIPSSELFKVELKLVKHSKWKNSFNVRLQFTLRSYIHIHHALFIVLILVSMLNGDTNVMKHVSLIISCLLLINVFIPFFNLHLFNTWNDFKCGLIQL